VGLDGINDAYLTGKGSFRVRAKVDIEQVSPKRMGLVVRELPYQVGTERVIERIKELVTNKKLQGISDIIDLTDYDSGLELIIELKHGFNPTAVLDQLYKLTPLEDSFHINNVALVEGQPVTLGLKPLLEVFLSHRLEVVKRRSVFRRNKAQERLHLVDGLLVSILDIDEVIAVIRSSDDTSAARDRLIQVFELSEIQANYILEMPLRRLTKFSRIELEKEQNELQLIIADLTDILDNEKRLKKVVTTELKDVADKYGDDRRTQLIDDDGLTMPAATSLEIEDDPCYVLLSATGLIARTNNTDTRNFGNKRANHDTIRSGINTSARADIGLITSLGRVLRIPVISLPALSDSATLTTAGGSVLKEFVTLNKNERPLALMSLDSADSTVFLATALGTVKRVGHDVPTTAGDWNIIRLDQGDYVVGATQVANDKGQIVLITDDAQLLRFDFSVLRASGRPAGGVAGIKLSGDAKVLFGAVIATEGELLVGTVAGDSETLAGTAAHSMKVTPLSEFPAKGRATGGVRCHKFLSGEDTLVTAVAGPAPLHACTGTGGSVELPTKQGKRDGSGSPVSKPVVALAAHPLG
ncbi:MAG: DNA topoisomerase IV, partial [Actinobacteria bacterium]|nr:DNA topoisomerase IV [Actinomycetota bacterium]